jgi:hypothetical protein
MPHIAKPNMAFDAQRIDLRDPESVAAWARALDVDPEMIVEAVELVGGAPDAV